MIGQLWPAVIAAVVGIVLLWVAMLVTLAVIRPGNLSVRDAVQLLPDTVVLLRRLAGDPDLPRGIRVRILLLLTYLVCPIDLIPDFIPVLGYADDAIVVAIALRSVTRRAGAAVIEEHWPGSAEGLEAVRRLAGVHDASD